MALARGGARLTGVSRRFRVLHDKSSTLKEVLVRRQRATYTELWALRDVDLEIEPGQSIGIVGRNGSGKSTLLKLLAGIIPPHEGTVETCGTVASMLELGSGFHPDFTGLENVYMNGAIYGLGEKEVRARLDEILAFAGIGDFIDMPVRTYSSGMQMRLAFAVASHVDPDILLLDEVLAVGDEAFQAKCLEKMYAYRRRGGTIVFVSHDPGPVEQMCDRAILVSDGIILADDVPSKVLAMYHRQLADRGSDADTGHQFSDTSDEHPVVDAPDDDAPVNEAEDREWGNRRALITKAEIVSEGVTRDRVTSGDPVAVRLHVQAVDTIVNPIFGVQFHSIDRTLAYETHSGLDGVGFPAIPMGGSVIVDFCVPSIPVHTGQLKVSLGVSDDGILCHHLEQWLDLTVFAASAGNGLVDMSGGWTMSAVPSPSEMGA